MLQTTEPTRSGTQVPQLQSPHTLEPARHNYRALMLQLRPDPAINKYIINLKKQKTGIILDLAHLCDGEWVSSCGFAEAVTPWARHTEGKMIFSQSGKNRIHKSQFWHVSQLSGLMASLFLLMILQLPRLRTSVSFFRGSHIF